MTTKKRIYHGLIVDSRSGEVLTIRVKAETVERAALLVYLMRDAIEEASRN